MDSVELRLPLLVKWSIEISMRSWGCRRARDGPWKLLPEHLLHIIMAKLEELAGIEEVADLCFVAKAWRAAFIEYSSSHEHCVGGSQLEGLLKMQPKLTGLRIHSYKQHALKLKSLTAAPHLTQLRLCGSTYKNSNNHYLEPLVKLNKLPPTLIKLGLDAVYADPAYFQDLKSTSLTSLSFAGQQNEDTEVLDLLQLLPKLKVLKTLACLRHTRDKLFDVKLTVVTLLLLWLPCKAIHRVL